MQTWVFLSRHAQWLMRLCAACRPGQPTVDMTHQKAVYARCYNPVSSTSPTSPVFDTYLADLGATINGATPIGLQAT